MYLWRHAIGRFILIVSGLASSFFVLLVVIFLFVHLTQQLHLKQLLYVVVSSRGLILALSEIKKVLETLSLRIGTLRVELIRQKINQVVLQANTFILI